MKINTEVATIQVHTRGEEDFLLALLGRKFDEGQPDYGLLRDTRPPINDDMGFATVYGELCRIEELDPLFYIQAIRVSDYCVFPEDFPRAANLFRAIYEIDCTKIEGQFWIAPGSSSSYRCKEGEGFRDPEYVKFTESIRASGIQLLRDWFSPSKVEGLVEYAVGEVSGTEIKILTIDNGFRYFHELSLYSPVLVRLDRTISSSGVMPVITSTITAEPILLKVHYYPDGRMYFTIC